MATNKITLYNDDGAGNIVAGVLAGKSGMECSSCHDVHNGARTKDQLLLTGLHVRLEPRSGWIHLHAVPPQVRRSQLWRRGSRRRALFLWRVRG